MKPFIAADILLPAPQTDMGLWPALACDQFTSQPEYWQKAEALTQNAPSTLHITLPEAYLESPDVDGRIAAIHTAMADYRARVLTRGVHGFVYVERATQSGVRQGLVGAVDLEAYSYEKGSAPLVRPSENTIVERIPPRLAVRRGAPLETPHIMMLLDDAACGVVEPFAKKKAALEKLYDTELMLGGGHIAGWAVTDAADIAAVENAVAALGTQAAFDAKYPDAGRRPPRAVAGGPGAQYPAPAQAHGGGIKAAQPPAPDARKGRERKIFQRRFSAQRVDGEIRHAVADGQYVFHFFNPFSLAKPAILRYDCNILAAVAPQIAKF